MDRAGQRATKNIVNVLNSIILKKNIENIFKKYQILKLDLKMKENNLIIACFYYAYLLLFFIPLLGI